MSSVEFDEPKYTFENKYAPVQNNQNTPVINLLIKMHLAKNPAQANLVMIGIFLVSVILTFIFIRRTFSVRQPPHIPNSVNINVDTK